jgi:SulP family sulfate permease
MTATHSRPQVASVSGAGAKKETVADRLKRHMLHEEWYTWTKMQQASFLKTEILLGITICFAQVPESVAFAFMAHIKPPVALHAAWVVGLICTVFGGRSGMVNGAEGAFAAIIATMVAAPETPGGNGEGIELLFPSVMCAGAFMLLIWAVGGDRFITLMAASVMDGFCCGLAIVIGNSQLHPFQLGHGTDKRWRNIDDPETWFMVTIMMCSMITMEFIPKINLTGRFEKFKDVPRLVPSSLLAILVAIFLEYAVVENLFVCRQSSADTSGHHRRLDAHGTRCSTPVIADATPFTLTYPYPFFLNSDYYTTADGTYSEHGTYNLDITDGGQILMQGALLAIAGVVQGLMTTEVVTSFVKTAAHTPSIVWSMGAANLVSGFLGGMGGDAMIGLSTINCLNGGRGRLAPTVTALGVMLCTMVAYPLLNYIPIASLAGVMIVVVLHTFKWAKIPMVFAASMPSQWRPKINKVLSCRCYPEWMRLPLEVDRWEAMIIVVVSSLTVLHNLVVGVGVGLVLSTLRFSWAVSQEAQVRVAEVDAEKKVYDLEGKLFFGNAMRFHTYFDVENDPEAVTLQVRCPPHDYSGKEALGRLSALYAAAGKQLTISVATPAAVKPFAGTIATHESIVIGTTRSIQEETSARMDASVVHVYDV